MSLETLISAIENYKSDSKCLSAEYLEEINFCSSFILDGKSVEIRFIGFVYDYCRCVIKTGFFINDPNMNSHIDNPIYHQIIINIFKEIVDILKFKINGESFLQRFEKRTSSILDKMSKGDKSKIYEWELFIYDIKSKSIIV